MMVVMVVMFPDLLGAFMSVGEPDCGDGDVYQFTCNGVLEGIGICRYNGVGDHDDVFIGLFRPLTYLSSTGKVSRTGWSTKISNLGTRSL